MAPGERADFHVRSVREAPRHSGRVVGLARPCVSFKLRGEVVAAMEGQRAGETKEGPGGRV